MFRMPFSVNDIARFCEFLEADGQLDRLERFLWSLPRHNNEITSCESILVSRAVVALRKFDFQQLYQIIEGKDFSERYHKKLQHLWYKARYAEAEMYRGRALDPVAKYRLRRKFPVPKTISDGQEKSYCFKQKTRAILNKAYEQKPYPCLADKRKLADDTELTVTQVSNWFKNKRQRIRMTQQRKREFDSRWPVIFNDTYNSCLLCHRDAQGNAKAQYPFVSTVRPSSTLIGAATPAPRV